MSERTSRRQFLAAAGTAVFVARATAGATAATTDWQYSYGGGGRDRFNAVASTGDGEAVAAGHVARDSGEGLALGIDGDGTERWVRGYRSPPNHVSEYGRSVDEIRKQDAFETVVPTGDGGAVLGGWFWPNDTDVATPWVVRVDANGWVRDQRLYTDLGEDTTHFNDGIDVDDGVVFCGGVGAGATWYLDQSDGYVAMLDDDVSPAWEYAYRPGARRRPDSRGVGGEFTAVERGTDGGLVLVGETMSRGTTSEPTAGWLAELDVDGTLGWQTFLDRGRNTRLHDLVQTGSSGYVAVGQVGRDSPGRDLYSAAAFDPDDRTDGVAVEVGADGSREWLRTYSDTPLYGVERAGDGYLFAGSASGTATALHVDGEGRPVESTTATDLDNPSVFTDVASDGSGHLVVGFETDSDYRPGALVARVPSVEVGNGGSDDGSGDDDDQTGDDDDDVSDEDTRTLAFSGRDVSGNSAYVFTYDGTLSKTRGGIEASINDLDVVSDGLVEGNVSNGADAYELTGSVTSIVVHGPATLTVDGTERDPADLGPEPSEPNVLFISGRDTGGPGTYEFEVSGSVVKSRYRQASINDDTETRDVVSGGRVDGRVASGADAFRFSGSLTSFALDGDLTVSLNGREIEPGDV